MPAASELKVSAPGSIMLMGEHAVLFGHRALACAVDCCGLTVAHFVGCAEHDPLAEPGALPISAMSVGSILWP